MLKRHESLTEQESAFAAEHHTLIYRYLSQKGLSEDEYYDIVVFGFLNGVRKYFRREELRQQYSFTTLAWSAMNTCLSNYKRSKACPKNHAKILSINEPFRSVYPLEEIISDARDYAEETLTAMCVTETLQSFEQTEREIVRLLMEGHPKSEICRQFGLTAVQMNDILNQIQTKTMSSPLMRAA